MTGSGTIDLTGLSFFVSGPDVAGINPILGALNIGPTGGAILDLYSGIIGPASFGSGGPLLLIAAAGT